MSNALLDLVNPSGETVAAMIGGMGFFEHVGYHLNASRSANYAANKLPSGPCLNGTWDSTTQSCTNGTRKRPKDLQKLDAENCQDFKTANENARWRWQQYGKAKRCPAIQPLDLTGMGCF